jgi:cell division protein FtsL
MVQQRSWAAQEAVIKVQMTNVDRKCKEQEKTITDLKASLETLERAVKLAERKAELEVEEATARMTDNIIALRRDHEIHVAHMRQGHEQAMSEKIRLWEDTEQKRQKAITQCEKLRAIQSVPLLSSAMEERIKGLNEQLLGSQQENDKLKLSLQDLDRYEKTIKDFKQKESEYLLEKQVLLSMI